MHRQGWRATIALGILASALWLASRPSDRNRDRVLVGSSSVERARQGLPPPTSAKTMPLSTRPASGFSAGAASPIAKALRANDVCGVASAIGTKSFSWENLSAYASGLALPEELRELLLPTSPFFSDSSSEFASAAGRFFQALLRAGLLDGVKSPDPLDLEAARSSLEGLEREDPGNGAFPYFRLAVETKLRFSEEQEIETVRAIAAADRFDAFIVAFGRELFQGMRRSSSHWLLGAALVSSVPAPNYLPSNLRIKTLTERYGLAEEARAIADLLMRQAQGASSISWEWGYSPIEYQVGRHLHGEVVNRSPAEALPTYVEIDRMREVERYGRPFNFFDLFSEGAVDRANCQRAATDTAFREFLAAVAPR